MKINVDCELIHPCVLRLVRNEYGKRIRKLYDKHMVKEQRKNIKELAPRPDEIANTLTTNYRDNLLVEPKLVALLDNNYRIRKLTPKECFRLMGVSDTDICKIQQSGVSKTQQYKLAGNSIVVDVMAYIFGRLFNVQLSNTVGQPRVEIKVPQKVGNIYPSGGQNGNVYSVRGISPTIASGTGVKGNGVGSCNAPKIIAPLKNLDFSSVIWRGVEMHEGEGFYLYILPQLGGLKGISRTLKAFKDDMATVQHGRIRKLTAREYFRLMGLTKNEIDKLQSLGISSRQQKKLAGNSIVVDVMACIFKNLLLKKEGA